MLHPVRAFLNDAQIAQLCARSLRVVGDLMCVVDGERGWIDGVDLGLPWLNEFTDKLSIPTDAVASRNGQG